MRWDSYYLFLLFVPCLFLFWLLVTWTTCIPIDRLDEYRELLGASQIPEHATCFVTNHMTKLRFFSFPPVADSVLSFATLLALFVGTFAGLIRPLKRLLLRRKTEQSGN